MYLRRMPLSEALGGCLWEYLRRTVDSNGAIVGAGSGWSMSPIPVAGAGRSSRPCRIRLGTGVIIAGFNLCLLKTNDTADE